jgi:hypothetical protein
MGFHLLHAVIGAAVLVASFLLVPPGFFQGLFMALGAAFLFFGFWNLALRWRRGPQAHEGWGVRRTRTVVLSLGAQEVLDRLQTVVANDREVRLVSVDRLALRVVGRTGASIRSWGERVEGKVIESGPGASTVELSSTPRLYTTLVDYGRGNAHLERIERGLEAVAHT